MKNKQHKSQHLTSDQMEMYVIGIMRSKESHQVQKHLLECDFCQEAMDGLENLKPKGGFYTDVELLKQRVTQIASGSSKRSIPYKEMAIAASILMLVGYGIYFFSSSYYTDRKLDNIAERNEIKEDVKVKKKTEKRLSEAEKLDIINESEITIEEDVLIHEDLIEQEKTVNEENIQVEDLIVVNENVELEDAEVVKSVQPIINSAKTSGTVKKLQPEENKFIDEGDDNVLDFKETSDNKNENTEAIPESSSGKKSFAESSSDKIEMKKAEPVGGMKSFNKYLRKKLKYPKEAKKERISGSINVSFQINKNGIISDIKIEKSLGYGCDEEAVRLIKEGPSWTPTYEFGSPIDDTVIVNIHFGKD